MKNTDSASKITARHLARKAVVYLRQSSIAQVRHNVESSRLQYARGQRRAWAVTFAAGTGVTLRRQPAYRVQ